MLSLDETLAEEIENGNRTETREERDRLGGTHAVADEREQHGDADRVTHRESTRAERPVEEEPRMIDVVGPVVGDEIERPEKRDPHEDARYYEQRADMPVAKGAKPVCLFSIPLSHY